jgi:hypothetical protein
MDLSAEEGNNFVEVMEMQMLYGLPFVHIECKRVEQLNIDSALEQAKADCKEGRLPAVFHRKNRKPWKVTMDLKDFMIIYSEYYSSLILAGREDK